MTTPFFSCLLFITSPFAQKLQICLCFMYLFQISSFSLVSGQCLDDQRALLLQLNSTLTYDSSYSTKLVQWNQNIDCCNWNGVECDSFGHVIGLELDGELITGGIEKQSALYSFRYLENLNLANNEFYSLQIQRELGNLSNLARLNLSSAGFAGQIHVELSQMASLVMLDLSWSGLGYPSLKNLVQNLTRLEELYLDTVDFKHKGDWLEALSLALPNLQSLSMCNCGLSGHINSSFLQLRTLSVLRLDGNDLSDISLDFLANFRNLTNLSLRECSLEGVFPARIFQVPTLQSLDLSDNYNLTGTIPEFPPGGSLWSLNLGYTKFSGSLMDSIINLSNLSIIDIFHCRFTGPIPYSIGNLTNLVSLDFAFNFFTGSIPDSIGNLTNLVQLDFKSNFFTGSIPSTIGNLTNLVSLSFENNFFTGSIPIFRMSNKLEDIDLSYNNLNGSLSSTHFEGLSNLQFLLLLTNNSLTGNIPTNLFGLPSLEFLDLSDNKFSGQVNEFSTLNSNLGELYLRNNHLEGFIPKSFFRLEKLGNLDLSFNFFNGTIQLEDFQTLQNLKDLLLGNNHLSINIDNINSGYSSFPQLLTLDLASCNLSRFPNLRNQTTIEDLDLSDNNISGDIPSWIWEVGNGSLLQLNLSHNLLSNIQTPYKIPSSLELLDLHSNMLHGELPVSGGSLEYLDYSNNHIQGHIGIFSSDASFFSVANNSLTGKIPIFLCYATSIRVIDLSNNLLSGVLPPCLVENLTQLGVLNIARNNISGNIPDTFSASCSLSTLDLSSNNFRGNIPPSLAKCKSLKVMNVASNNISDTFPCILLKSSSLHVLVLRYNKFFGDIRCHGFGHNRSNLQILDIAFNSFTGFVDQGFISSLTGMKLKNNPRLTGEPLGFDEVSHSINYRDTVTVTVKGLELEIVKILTILTSIDFSSNKFRGAIPQTFGELSSLYALNLSHNSFTGTIPKSLGNLTELESLSLSANHLTGNIPTELVRLTSLSSFDVSYNELVGRIPSGSQFDTFSTANYEGNLGLCGSLVNKSCDSNVPTETSTSSTEEKDFDWMFMLAGIGYATGIALVVVPPLFSRRCGKGLEELQRKLLRLICPRYRG